MYDYDSMQAAASDYLEPEEAVTVNTRALIDKVLARYSGEWTTLRELVQNAADAQATTVRVKWKTIPSTKVALPPTPTRSDLLQHTISHHTLRRLVVENDGQPFSQTDWNRLKRIAEGNPDETKIGAFGVGFYSVFADCENPHVSSGGVSMRFFWKGNSLFTQKSRAPACKASRNTVFLLDYRNTTSAVPNLLSVSQFLATSLTFVALQKIELWIDDYQILSLRKMSSPSAELPLPQDLEARTKQGHMKVVAVYRTSTQIDTSYMSVLGWKPQPTQSASKSSESFGANEAPSLKSFFARLTSSASHGGFRSRNKSEDSVVQPMIVEDVTRLNSSVIFLQVTSANIDTIIPPTFASELERATKKPPPKVTRLSILTSSLDETQASDMSGGDAAFAKATDVFRSVLPSKKPGGRIFIGFPVMQTTGAGMHISAPSIIPTVEREAIDLNARWVKTWNQELLRAAGIVSRLAFANEMENLSKRVQGSLMSGVKMTGDIIAKYVPQAAHDLDTFSFGDSTPSGQVGVIIEEAFWTCFRKASIEVFSSRGVLPTTQVRQRSDELVSFVDNIPVIPKELSKCTFVQKLIDFGLISHITVNDVKRELEAKALSKTQAINFITWTVDKSLSRELDLEDRSVLLGVAVATLGDDRDQGEVIALGSIRNFQNVQRIPAILPIPPTTIPFELVPSLLASQLQALGWEPLEVISWLRYLIESTHQRPEAESITRSPKFTIQILIVLSKNWDLITARDRDLVASLLRQHTVMPTKLGMRQPTESFFPSVKLFDDLPVIQGCEKVKAKFLAAIGVRKTVDLDTIFARLLNIPGDLGETKWSHMELIKYLASVLSDIPSSDLQKLKQSKFCPAECGPQGMEPAKGTSTLFQISELFEPKDTLRTLKLPILQWPGPPGSFRPTSPEGQFLSSMGLRAYPSVPELVDMMASKDESLRASAMTYFIANHHSHNYAAFEIGSTRKAILPLQGVSKLVAPADCFTNDRASALGFNILRKDLHIHAHKFGVARDPPMLECVHRLVEDPPRDHQAATLLFGYFASRISELKGQDNSLHKLRNAPMVPITRSALTSAPGKAANGTTSHTRPIRTYLGTSTTFAEIFDFVNFGPEANSFLFHCGAKSEPTKVEVAHLVSTEPARLLDVLQSSEKYLDMLKSLSEVTSTLQRHRDLWKRMKAAPCLLAYRELATNGEADGTEPDDEGSPIKQYQLVPADQIVVVDDIISFRLFKEHLICAPEEDSLETFYLELGAQKLSSRVKDEIRIGSQVVDEKKTEMLRKHILERAKLFLHEYSSYRRDGIKRDAKWLEKNLKVTMVRSVALSRSLKTYEKPQTEKRSAAASAEKGSWTLYVADEKRPNMYQIGQAICQMLLERSNQQAYLFFEPFLNLDLYGLRARGYNVDRILRAKAIEARMAEEQRQRALEEEQKRIQEQELSWRRQGSGSAESLTEPVKATEDADASEKMPGGWGPPEVDTAEGPTRTKKGESLFSSWTRRLNLAGSQGGEQDDGQKKLGQRSADKAGSDGRHSKCDRQSEGGWQADNGKQPRENDGRVTNPAVVKQNLLNAINSTRAHGSHKVFSEPTVTEVKEQATYCDKTPATNVVFAAEAAHGIKVFVSKHMAQSTTEFLSANTAAINSFAALLVEVGSIYSLSPQAIHIFHDEAGGTIAFNTGGSIFCNLRFFIQLHASSINGPNAGAGLAEAASWWWVVLAHELAHNLVGLHNSDHSFYTESFIQQYVMRMTAKITQWTQQGEPASQRSSLSLPPPGWRPNSTPPR